MNLSLLFIYFLLKNALIKYERANRTDGVRIKTSRDCDFIFEFKKS